MVKMVHEAGKPARPPKRDDNRDDRARVKWLGYVSPQITQAEKLVYKAWRDDADSFAVAFRGALEEGFKASVDFQSREGAYRASLYCQVPHRKEAGYCLTIFAGDPFEALYRVVFVHSELYGGDWTPLLSKGGWKDDWT